MSNTVSTRSDLRTIRRAVAIIETFRGLDPRIASETIHVFLAVAARPGSLRRELERDTGLSQASVNRHIAMLTREGDFARTQKEGLGLVFTDADPLDSRANRVYLTTAGNQVVKRIANIMEDRY